MNKPLFSLFVIVLSIVFAFFYIKPEYALSQKLSADLITISSSFKDPDAVKTLIRETEKNLQSVNSSDLLRFNVFLPETVDPVRFANNIQHLGFKNGILLEGINVAGLSGDAKKNTLGNTETMLSSATRGIVNTVLPSMSDTAQTQSGIGSALTITSLNGKYISTKASFTFTTTYEKLLIFLNDIEKSLGLINITEFSFHPILVVDTKNAKNSPLMYQFMFTVETYSLK